MTGSTYGPYIWTSSAAYPVSGLGGGAQGGHYCIDGTVTDQNCSAAVSASEGGLVGADAGAWLKGGQCVQPA